MARLAERERSAAHHPRKTPSTYWMGNQLRGAPPRCLRDAIIHHYGHYRPPSIPRFTPDRRASFPSWRCESARARNESLGDSNRDPVGLALADLDDLSRASHYAPSSYQLDERRAKESCERIARRVSAVAEPLP
jgi:hypothetical protein